MNSENKRDVYLPEGSWVNFFTGEKIAGDKWLRNVEVSMEDMPVWVKEGAAIPIYPEAVNCTDDMDLKKSVKIKMDINFKGIWRQLDFIK
jgi:alpha-D-xyloside xylohydrolase